MTDTERTTEDQTPSGKCVGVPRLVSLMYVARSALIINAMACVMAVIGTIHSETLRAALFWPWVTFIAVRMTSKAPG